MALFGHCLCITPLARFILRSSIAAGKVPIEELTKCTRQEKLMPFANRREKRQGQNHFLVVACSDDACAPEKEVREFLAQKGLTETVPRDHIHRIRHVAGIHFPRYFGRGDADRTALLEETLEAEIEAMIELKGISMIFVDGHNPCGGCIALGIEEVEQKTALIEFGRKTFFRFGLPTVVMFEDHSCEHHDSHAIAEYGLASEKAVVAAE